MRSVKAYSHDALVSELVRLDIREEASERKRGNRVNVYRIAHYLRAADNVRTSVEHGSSPSFAFASAFCATRGMHRIARNLGLALDVKRGEWIETSEGA